MRSIVRQKIMNTLLTISIAVIGFIALAGCDNAGSHSSQAGSVSGMSYHAWWRDNSRTTENLSLLVIADYTNEQSTAKGQRLSGGSEDPILSGYFDRDGEVVSFALLKTDRLQILDKYLHISEQPIAYVYRDNNGLLDAKLLRADDPKAAAVLDSIEKE